MRVDLPKHMKREHGTERQWKQHVRLRLRAALPLLEYCRFGCAYTPDGGESVVAAIKALEDAIRVCSQKSWGR